MRVVMLARLSRQVPQTRQSARISVPCRATPPLPPACSGPHRARHMAEDAARAHGTICAGQQASSTRTYQAAGMSLATLMRVTATRTGGPRRRSPPLEAVSWQAPVAIRPERGGDQDSEPGRDPADGPLPAGTGFLWEPERDLVTGNLAADRHRLRARTARSAPRALRVTVL